MTGPGPDPDWDDLGPPTHEKAQRATDVARQLAAQAVEEDDQRIRSLAKGAGAAEARRISRRSALLLLLVALVVPLLVASIALSTALDTAGEVEDVQVALDRLDQANAELAARGQPTVELPPEADAEEVSAAAITAQVVASLPPTPTAEQVADLLRGAVVAQLQGPTVDELTRLTADYFARIPAPPGPTEAQIRAAVQAELAENPPERGERGERGEPGESCLPSNPECVGPEGPQGDQGEAGEPGQDGRSVVSGPEPVRDENGDCIWRTTYDRAPLVEEYPAGEFACPLMAPPTTEQPPPTTG